MTKAPTLVLHPSRERSLLRGHPWIFSGAIAELRGHADAGETVLVCSSRGEPLGQAAYNPRSKITARMWTFLPDEEVDRAFFTRKLAAAIERRTRILPEPARNACRLVHGESDGLPGLIVDRYGEQLVLSASSAGAARHRELLAAVLCEVTGLSDVYERSDADVLELEGLEPRTGVLCGHTPSEPIVIDEGGARFVVDVAGGHKTGFYLDQRDNRALVRRLAADRDVLDVFCFSAGFAVNAALGGARSVHAVDSSQNALVLARANVEQSGVPADRLSFEAADAFSWLRKARDAGKHFDLIVLDPPKFAPTARLAERAARGYKDINLLAFKLLRPGGLLLTFSCSGGVSPDLFQKIVAGAASDAEVQAAITHKLCAGPDHPIGLAFPEGEYLKGLCCAI
jgi:23S rRNA (cytosine1962-C5)-methyltransferase